nr:N-acetylmuramoyl-L-alanine amidase [Rugamonas sp.]
MKKLLLTVLFTAFAALLAGCAAPGPKIDTTYVARGQSDRIKFVIVHYTVGNLPSSLKTLTEEVVSSHYLLTDTDPPFFYALVDESRQANHAGVSNWKNYTLLNGSSIGIEIVNPGFKDTPEGRLWYPFQPAQIDQLIALLGQIVARHHIAPENILGHNEIAPQRKEDPGPLFPWKRLADAGLIAWPDAGRVAAQLPQYLAQLPDPAWFQKKLALHGYAVPQNGQFDKATQNVIAVFQTKFRPAKFDGQPDAETAALLDVLTTPAGVVPTAAPAMPAATAPSLPSQPQPSTPSQPPVPPQPQPSAANPAAVESH